VAASEPVKDGSAAIWRRGSDVSQCGEPGGSLVIGGSGGEEALQEELTQRQTTGLGAGAEAWGLRRDYFASFIEALVLTRDGYQRPACVIRDPQR
jgi:hypothetical protein